MHKGRLLMAAALAAAAQAQAQGIEVKLSGQVNRGVMLVDDGVQSDSFHVDNDNSSTRFRFAGTGEISPGLKAGLIFEVEYQSSPSNLVTFADRDGASPTTKVSAIYPSADLLPQNLARLHVQGADPAVPGAGHEDHAARRDHGPAGAGEPRLPPHPVERRRRGPTIPRRREVRRGGWVDVKPPPGTRLRVRLSSPPLARGVTVAHRRLVPRVQVRILEGALKSVL